MAIVAVLGAGMMGTALCYPISDAGHTVRLVGTHLDQAWVDGMKRNGAHPKVGVPLPERVTAFSQSELGYALDGAEIVAVGVSSAGVRWAAETLGSRLREGTPVIAVTKGLEESAPGVLRILPEVFHEALPERLKSSIAPAAIAGPCIAGELARRVPTAVVFTGRERASLERLAQAFSTSYYHVRVSSDVIGVEVCAALKNAYAMAVGFGAGVHERAGLPAGPVAHHNYESAIFAQACIEMTRLVRALGGEADQVPNLAGAGDMLVTCSGGRSSRLGKLLGSGLTFEQARERMAGDTLESADIIRVVGGALDAMASRGSLTPDSMPLMRHLHDVIVRGANVDIPFHQFFRGE